MDAGACSTCQYPLGELNLDGMLGLFPRVRCGACGLVNVLLDGSAPIAAVPPPSPRGNETFSLDENPLYAQPEELAAPAYEEPAVSPYGDPAVSYEEPSAAYEAPVASPYEEPSAAYEEPSVPSYEEPSEVSAPPEFEVPSFDSGAEAPPYEENIDYEKPVPMQGAIPDGGDYDQEVGDLPIESTRISIDPSEENNEQ